MPSLLSQTATARSTIRYDSAPFPSAPTTADLQKNTEKLSFLRVFLINQPFWLYVVFRADSIKLRTVFSLLN